MGFNAEAKKETFQQFGETFWSSVYNIQVVLDHSWEHNFFRQVMQLLNE